MVVFPDQIATKSKRRKVSEKPAEIGSGLNNCRINGKSGRQFSVSELMYSAWLPSDGE